MTEQNEFLQVIGGFTYGMSITVGNLLRVGIIHFERFGGDPMKRSLGNHMISFIFETSCVNVLFPGVLIAWYFLTGPIGKKFALVAVFSRQVSTMVIFFSMTEHIWHKCLMMYFWKTSSYVNDEFFARFCKLFNVLASVLLSCVHLQVGNLESQLAFKIFAVGNEEAKKDPSIPGRFLTVQTMTLLGLSVIGFIAIKFKKRAEKKREARILPRRVEIGGPDQQNINDVEFNKSLLSNGQVIVGLAFVVGCLMSVHLSKWLEIHDFWSTYAEVVFMALGQVVPAMFYASNADLRKYVWTQFSDWLMNAN